MIVLAHDLIDLFTLHYGVYDEAVSGSVLTHCLVASLADHPPDLTRTLVPGKFGLGAIDYVYQVFCRGIHFGWRDLRNLRNEG